MKTKIMMITSMLTKTTLQSILILCASLFCTSCSNDSDDQEDIGGIVAQTTPLLESIGVTHPVKSINQNSWNKIIFNYLEGRMVSGNDMEDEIGNFTITSNPLKISASCEDQYDSSRTSYSMLRINEQGYLTYGKEQTINIATEDGETITETFENTLKAEYDSNGYITHLTVEWIDHETSGDQRAIEERYYTWKNGNLIKIEEKEIENGEAETYITTYSYDNDATQNLNSGIFFGINYNNAITYSGLLGRPSKNIPVSTSYSVQGLTPTSRNVTTNYDILGRIISCNINGSLSTYGY